MTLTGSGSMQNSDLRVFLTDALKVFFWVSLIVILFAAANEVFANEKEGGDLPWEEGLDKLRRSISGPVAKTLALVGIVACGAMLIFGQEISGVLKSMITLVLVVCIIIFANSIINSFGGDAAEIIPPSQEDLVQPAQGPMIRE